MIQSITDAVATCRKFLSFESGPEVNSPEISNSAEQAHELIWVLLEHNSDNYIDYQFSSGSNPK